MNEHSDNTSTTISDWPTLVPLDRPPLPDLPKGLLPSWAEDMARAVTASLEIPYELAACLILATGSACTARRFHVAVRTGHVEATNLWVLAPLPPGARKSPALGLITKPLVHWEASQVDDGESKQPRLWTADTTPEQLGTLLDENEQCMAILSAEGGIFDNMAGRYGGVPNLDLILKSYSADPHRIDRRTQPTISLPHPRVTMGLSPQPGIIEGLAEKGNFRAAGLTARFLTFLPHSNLGHRTLDGPDIPEGVLHAYQEGIIAMLGWDRRDDAGPGEPPTHAVHLSDEAKDTLRGFALQIEREMREGGKLEHMTDWGGKAPGMAIRIAAVLHGFVHAHDQPWDHEIAGETMDHATAIMAVGVAHAQAAYGLMGADPLVHDATRAWEWIQKQGGNTITARDLFNALRGRFPQMHHVNAALGVLEERGYIRLSEPLRLGRPGRRPSPTIDVRPELRREVSR